MGTLYVVPTPIGNMSDVSERMRKTLEEADFIACEDTRVGGKLLLLLGIKKPMVPYHEHNKKQCGKEIIKRIVEGSSCALITDAGTPAISDPGEDLVRLCHENGITVVPIAGPCAAVTALSSSGIPCKRFCFEGFLPEGKTEKDEYLASMAKEVRAMVFYSPPHDLSKVLSDLYSAFGDRAATLCKELTKLNEKITYSTLGKLLEEVSSVESVKGEYVIVVQGYIPTEDDEFWHSMTVEQHVEHYVNLGLLKMDAVKAVASDRGVGKGEIYKIVNCKSEIENL
jgi:16S rRNA (cytidine1402-2'-O)-methyltransferase